jgi:branched-chain amino acid transport system ATP-binding protein
MISPVLLRVDGVSKRFGGFAALSDVDLQVTQNERLGLIGPNGSGKTTLINCISGLLKLDAGSITFDGDEISGMAAYRRTRLGIARSFQLPLPFRSMTVLENLIVPLEYVTHRRLPQATNLREEASHILEQMGLAEKANTITTSLTQVDLRKLELARAIATRPRLLISDEAMAGLSSAEIQDVVAILRKLNENGITVIMIEHIMSAVMSFSQRVICLDAGQIICEGTPEAIVKNPEIRRAYLGA